MLVLEVLNHLQEAHILTHNTYRTKTGQATCDFLKRWGWQVGDSPMIFCVLDVLRLCSSSVRTIKNMNNIDGGVIQVLNVYPESVPQVLETGKICKN